MDAFSHSMPGAFTNSAAGSSPASLSQGAPSSAIIRLAQTGQRISLFLDLDMTVMHETPPANDPQAYLKLAPNAFVPAAFQTVLRGLFKSGVSIAAITGRPFDFWDQLTGELKLPVAGEFGAHIRREIGGEVEKLKKAPDFSQLAARLYEMTGRDIEIKKHYAVIHYGENDPDQMHDIVRQAVLKSDAELIRLVEDGDIILHQESDRIEIGPLLSCKGNLFTEIYRPGTLPVVIGDTPDKDGPMMRQAACNGGQAFAVLNGRHRDVFQDYKDVITGYLSCPDNVTQQLQILYQAIRHARPEWTNKPG